MSVRQSVVVDGVTLSREQVEKAMEALKEPVRPQPVNLMPVTFRWGGHPGVLIIGEVQYRYAKAAQVVGAFTVVNAEGYASTYHTPESLWESWSPVEPPITCSNCSAKSAYTVAKVRQ